MNFFTKRFAFPGFTVVCEVFPNEPTHSRCQLVHARAEGDSAPDVDVDVVRVGRFFVVFDHVNASDCVNCVDSVHESIASAVNRLFAIAESAPSERF
jgi:hypothetical protein